MEFLRLKQNVCRICLESNVIGNWEERVVESCEVRYKDCYFKYMQLDEPDLDCYPKNLCDKCANEVKNAYILFEKALESLNIFENALKSKEHELDKCYTETLNSGSNNYQICSFDDNYANGNLIEEKPIMDVGDIVYYSPIYYSDTIDETENAINNLNENSKIKNINEQYLESTFDIPVNKEFLESSHTKNSSVNNEGYIRKKYNSSFETTLELNIELEISRAKSKTISKTPVNKTKSCNSLHETSLKQQSNVCNDKFATKRLVQHTENRKNNTIKLQKLSPIKNPKVEIAYDSSDCLNLKQDLVENFHLNAPRPQESDHDSSIQKRPYSPTCNNSNNNRAESQDLPTKKKSKQKVTYDSTDYLFLKQNLGEDFDVNSLLAKSPRQKQKICQYCSLKLKDSKSMRNHEATHLENRKRTETCPECGLKFYTKVSLTAHMKIHIENRQKKHKCEFCDKDFFHKGALNVHRRKHLGLMVKCQICSKEYCRQVDLNKHLLSHSAIPLQNNEVEKLKFIVKCQTCNKSVRTNHWREHNAVHLNKPEVKCKICDKIFFIRSKCVKHLKKVHRKTASEYEENIHYFVDCRGRISRLMMTQQEKVQPLEK